MSDASDDRKRSSFKSAAALVVSIIAFAISVLTFLFSTAIKFDLVTAEVGTVPRVTRFSDGSFGISTQSDIELIFINSGNRPAVVARVRFNLIELISSKTRECTDKQEEPLPAEFATTLKPFVLKENEASVQTVTIAASGPLVSYEGIKWSRFEVSEEAQKSELVILVVCLEVVLSSSLNNLHFANIEVYSYDFAKSGRVLPTGPGRVRRPEPDIVLSGAGTVFSQFWRMLRNRAN